MKRLNTLAPSRSSNDWNEGSARTASPKCPSKSEFFDSIDPSETWAGLKSRSAASPDLILANQLCCHGQWQGSDAIRSIETGRVHHTVGRHGSVVAARGPGPICCIARDWDTQQCELYPSSRLV